MKSRVRETSISKMLGTHSQQIHQIDISIIVLVFCKLNSGRELLKAQNNLHSSSHFGAQSQTDVIRSQFLRLMMLDLPRYHSYV